jgi:hypothetical protein
LQLHITRTGNHPINCYVDASFANGKTHRSISGHAIFFGATLIHAQVTPIDHAVDSSAHAEAYGLHHSIKSLGFLKNMFRELRLHTQPINIYTDSKALHDFTYKSGSGKRSRHWDIALHYMKTYLEKNAHIKIHFIPGRDNLADMYTKSIYKGQFLRYRHELGLRSPNEAYSSEVGV